MLMPCLRARYQEPWGAARRGVLLAADGTIHHCCLPAQGSRGYGRQAMNPPDAVVVGSGPNGLAAALTLARAGLTVEVFEGSATAGGGCRTEELTLPGFRHDVCSAVHPLVLASRFFRTVDMEARGVKLLTPVVAFAHPLDGGRAGAVVASVHETADRLAEDAGAYYRVFAPLVRDVGEDPPYCACAFEGASQAPRGDGALRAPGAAASPPARRALPHRRSQGAPRWGGRPLDAPAQRPADGIVRAAVRDAWPRLRLARGPRGELSPRGRPGRGARLAGRTGAPRPLGQEADELPPAKVVLLDVSPRQLAQLAGGKAPPAYRRGARAVPSWAWRVQARLGLERPGALGSSEACREAGTVHLGGTLEEVSASEAAVAEGRHPERPFCIVAQPGVVDPCTCPAKVTRRSGPTATCPPGRKRT